MILLWIGLGGGVGALARFGLGGWVGSWAGAGFPWGTFAANVLGSGLLGFLGGRFTRLTVSVNTRASLTVGLCGGFTTFSAFDYETLVLLQQGRWLLAATYSAGSVVACVAGVFLGMWAADAPMRRAARTG